MDFDLEEELDENGEWKGRIFPPETPQELQKTLTSTLWRKKNGEETVYLVMSCQWKGYVCPCGKCRETWRDSKIRYTPYKDSFRSLSFRNTTLGALYDEYERADNLL